MDFPFLKILFRDFFFSLVLAGGPFLPIATFFSPLRLVFLSPITYSSGYWIFFLLNCISSAKVTYFGNSGGRGSSWVISLSPSPHFHEAKAEGSVVAPWGWLIEADYSRRYSSHLKVSIGHLVDQSFRALGCPQSLQIWLLGLPCLESSRGIAKMYIN